MLLIEAKEFEEQLAKAQQPIILFRHVIKQGRENLRKAFFAGEDVNKLVLAHTQLNDFILKQAWHYHQLPKQDICLMPVGGYGRNELHPYSDIDILILHEQPNNPKTLQMIEKFLTFMWDIGLELGHSVRTLEQSVQAAKKDITIITNLLDGRFLIGDLSLYTNLIHAISSDKVWRNADFFQAKWQEQIQRHLKHDDTAYDLEPNIKNGPGGLRDLHTIAWVTRRHFGGITLHDLVSHHFLTENEYQILLHCQSFLWKVRFALHYCANRRDDRLLFDYQIAIAQQFGYRDNPDVKGIEAFMKDYFRTVMELRALNDMLLQLFKEAIIDKDSPANITALNERFQIRNDYIEAVNVNIFAQQPSTLLEIFVLLIEHPQIKGVRAATIRAIRENCHLINSDFRNNSVNKNLFLKLLQHRSDISAQLRRMNRYGILGKYLPEFKKITGLMQYDLYHHYTVDQHTLFLIRNICDFLVPIKSKSFSMCARIISGINKIELLFIAALYHDIAKGSKEDHSKLGAKLVKEFCKCHDLDQKDTELVTWLVEHHLLMSYTAQRKDINDPEVVNEFARLLHDHDHLDYLYLLTVADICATNPKLWNSWRDSLLKQLYYATSLALPRLDDNPINRQEVIDQLKQDALFILQNKLVSQESIINLWQKWDDNYFLRETVNNLVNRTLAILQHKTPTKPLIVIHNEYLRGVTEIFIYTKTSNDLFSRCTAIIDRLGLNVLEASIITTEDGYTLDTFAVLNTETLTIANSDNFDSMRKQIFNRLNSGKLLKPRKRRLSKQQRHFHAPTEVYFDNSHKQFTILQVTSTDHPGLLAQLGAIFIEYKLQVLQAKILTKGERVEDVFHIIDHKQQALTDETIQTSLKNSICKQLALLT